VSIVLTEDRSPTFQISRYSEQDKRMTEEALLKQRIRERRYGKEKPPKPVQQKPAF
jgi:hypothetical protein